MRRHFTRGCVFVALLFATGYLSAAHAAGVALATNYTAYRAGDRMRVTGHADAIQRGFDAWAVILSPGRQMYFMSLAGTIAPGAVPLARAVPALPTGVDATLLSMQIPPGLTRGKYEAVMAFLPAGTAPSSVEDAEAKAIPGCFARVRFYLVSGLVAINIDGTWNVEIEGLGSGVMTIARYPDNLIVDGDFAGEDGLGNASVLGFIDLDTFTLFLNFADKPGKTDMILKGGTQGAGLSGTWSSEVFDPPSGTWTAARHP